MMYLLGETGQLCNQLFRLAHHVGNSLHYNYKLNCTVFRYKKYFPHLSSHPLITVSEREATWQRKLAKAIAKGANHKLSQNVFNKLGVPIIAKPHVFSDKDDEFVNSVNKRIILVTTWLFRDYNNLNRHAESIRYLFKPDPLYTKQAHSIVKKRDELIIGVHIRRGDYVDWENGKYYYSDLVYRELIKYLLTLPRLSNATFVLCSNDNVDQNIYSDLPVIMSIGNHFMTDLTILSDCNYIIGPPSTFSAWASFMGKVPLFHILSPDDRPELEDFSVSIG